MTFYDSAWQAANSRRCSLSAPSVGLPASGKCYLASSHRKPRGAEVLLPHFDYFFILLRLGVFHHFTKKYALFILELRYSQLQNWKNSSFF